MPQFYKLRMPEINNSNLSNENKELNNEAWTTSRGYNRSSFPNSADLSNDFISIILESDQRKIYPLWG